MLRALFSRKPVPVLERFYVIDCNDGSCILEHCPSGSPVGYDRLPGGEGMQWHERNACIVLAQVGFKQKGG